MMVDGAEERQLKGPIDVLAPYTSAAFSEKRATRRRPHAFGALSITDLPGGGTSASIEVVDAPHLFQVKVA
jgi:hypothetical protein